MLLLVLLAVATPVRGFAADAGSPVGPGERVSGEQKTLVVGVAGEPPAVIPSASGAPSGLAVQYWADIAPALGLAYRLVLYPSTEDSLSALADGDLDVVIGDITITAERIAQFDLTQPITRARLTLLVHSSPPTLWGAIRPFLGWTFVSSVGGLFLCLFIVGNLLWIAERDANTRQFPQAYVAGVREGIWCALVTFATVGYGDRIPVTRAGRWVAGIWMIISLVVVTSLTAGIAATLALAFSSQPSEQFRRPEDIEGARIGVVGHESAQALWARYYQARVSETPNLLAAVALLRDGRVDAVLHSRLLLQRYLAEHPQDRFQVVSFDVASTDVGIALPIDSPLARPLNEKILQVATQLRFRTMEDEWDFASSPGSVSEPH